MTEPKKNTATNKQEYFYFPSLGIAQKANTRQEALLIANKRYKEAEETKKKLEYDVDNDGDFDKNDVSKLAKGLRKSKDLTNKK